jgi:hypothetical protein
MTPPCVLNETAGSIFARSLAAELAFGRLARRLAWLGALWAGLALGAGAATNYVALTGASAPYDGSSWTNAFTNLSAALNGAASGTVICVKGESFPVTNQLNWTSSYVTILGGYAGSGTPGELTNAETAIYRSAGTTRIMLIAGVTNGRLERVTLRGGNADDGASLKISNATGLVLVNCIFPATPTPRAWAARVRESRRWTAAG